MCILSVAQRTVWHGEQPFEGVEEEEEMVKRRRIEKKKMTIEQRETEFQQTCLKLNYLHSE